MDDTETTTDTQFSDPEETGLRRRGRVHGGVVTAAMLSIMGACISCSLLVTEITLTLLGAPGVVGSIGPLALFTAGMCALAYSWYRVSELS